jgi:hypothetical protein
MFWMQLDIFSFKTNTLLVLAQIHFSAALAGASYAGTVCNGWGKMPLIDALLRWRFELGPGGEDGKTKVSIALAQRDLSASRLQIGVGRKQLAALHRPSGDFCAPKRGHQTILCVAKPGLELGTRSDKTPASLFLLYFLYVSH